MPPAYIAVNLRHGLCNRLRTLVGYRAVACALEVPLYVCWQRDDECPGDFFDCFEPIDGVLICKYLNGWRNLAAEADGHKFVGQRPAYAVLKDCKKWLDDCPRKALVDFCALRPNKAVQGRIDEFLARHDGFVDVIGLHVRRTDHIGCAKGGVGYYTTDEDFDALIAAEPATKRFFLATDNVDSQRRFAQKYGERIFWVRAIQRSGRQRQTSLEDAVVDLFLLARCEKMHGSVWSSFSETARALARCNTE